MATPDIIRGTYVTLMLGDGAGSETFTALCGITNPTFRSITNTNDQATRDCADPEDVPFRRLITSSKQWSISGEGLLNRANIEDINAADDGLPHNWRFAWTEPADDLVYQGYYAGAAIVTSLEIGGPDDNFASISIQIESDGAWAFVPV